MTFQPGRERWLSYLMWGIIVLPIVALIIPLYIEAETFGILGKAMFILGTVIFSSFMALMWFSLQYKLAEDGLNIRVFPTNKTIPYDKITKARKIESWETSTATLKNRIEIRYGTLDYIHISPRDQERFLQELGKRCPHLIVE